MRSRPHDLDALYEEHIRPLPRDAQLRLLARIAEEVAREQGQAQGSESADAEACAVVDEGGLLVLTGTLSGTIPDHRDIREEHLDGVAGVDR